MEQHEIDGYGAEIARRNSERMKFAAAMMACHPDLSPLPPADQVAAFRQAREIRRTELSM
ncbi:MAG: hypothetical protein ACMVO3_22565 [Thalassobaculum sp.]